MATVKLHRCNYTFLHTEIDACWRVQKALDEQGIDYEIVGHGWTKAKHRPAVEALSGQSKLPVIELPDGSAYREESRDMAAKVRAGDLLPG
jgi:glutathione S-transferase